jgi:hypothetical protein
MIGALCNRDKELYIAKRLKECSGIYVPLNEKGRRWQQAGACLWNAPPCISVKYALEKHYARDSNISILFRTFLNVEDVHLNDYLDQLRYSKRTGLDAKGSRLAHLACTEIYRELSNYQATPELLERMR